jgi:hypothetical protein
LLQTIVQVTGLEVVGLSGDLFTGHVNNVEISICILTDNPQIPEQDWLRAILPHLLVDPKMATCSRP